MTQTESQSRLGILWITSIVMEATSAPLTESERRPESREPDRILDRSVGRLRQTCGVVFTDDGVQGERALPENLLVAGHGRTLLTSLLVQISQHHVDLSPQRTTNIHFNAQKRKSGLSRTPSLTLGVLCLDGIPSRTAMASLSSFKMV